MPHLLFYAAEWWRREYDGSSWSWKKVFSSFGADAKALTIARRSLVVESGLRYWGRKVRIINGNSRYLGSIAIEGGLPLNQLNKSSGWLGRVFKQAIPKYTRLQHTGIHADTLIGECDYIIPPTYQNDQIHAILGDMVQTVVALKQKYQLHERDSPVSYLDQQIPSWRERFPLPIETEVGQKLLSDMIITVAKAADEMSLPFRGIRCVRDGGSLQLQLEFAGFIPLEKLDLPETIPPRLDVELISSAGAIRSLGVALKTRLCRKYSEGCKPHLICGQNYPAKAINCL